MHTTLQFLASPLAHALIHSLGWTLLHFCWQGTIVSAVLWAVLELLSGRSSQARYVASCAALALLVALPLTTFAHIASIDVKNARTTWESAVPIDPALLLQVAASDVSVPWPQRIALAVDHRMPWLIALWLVGALFFVARLNFGLLIARRLKSTATEAPSAELLELFDRLRRRLGIDRAVRLLHSARVQVPTVIGWLRPVVLIPASCLTGLSPQQIEAIFCHELAHVRRHDYLVSVFQSIAEALLFYHPAVWWISKQVRRERECCCDDIAIANGGDVLSYAKALSYLEERRAAFPEFVLGANGGVLSMRIKRLLGCKQDAPASQFAAFTLLLLMITVAGSYAVSVAKAQSKTTDNSVAEKTTAIAPHAQERYAMFASAASSSLAGLNLSEIYYRGLNSFTLSQVADRFSSEKVVLRPGTPYEPAQTSRAIAVLKQMLAEKDHPYATVALVTKSIPPGSIGLLFKVSEGPKARNNEPLANSAVRPPRSQVELAAKEQPAAPPPPTPGQPTRIPVNSMQPTNKVMPAYPDMAKAAHVHGPVLLRVSVSTSGDIQNVSVVSGPTMLWSSAIDAVRQWKFQPWQPNGEHQQAFVETIVLLNFHLNSDGSTSVDQQPDPVRGPIRVSAGVLSGNIISKVNPIYPPDAKAAGIQGAVVLHATIGKDGSVENLQVVSGPPQLTQSALDAVKQWIYNPYLLNGQPTEVDTTITVNYSLDPPPAPSTPSPQAAIATTPRLLADGATAPVVLYQVEPEFTESARKAKSSGIVLLNLTIDKQGTPQNVHVLRGIGYGLNRKAIEAVRQYRFKPAMKDSQPVEEALNIEVNFQIF